MVSGLDAASGRYRVRLLTSRILCVRAANLEPYDGTGLDCGDDGSRPKGGASRPKGGASRPKGGARRPKNDEWLRGASASWIRPEEYKATATRAEAFKERDSPPSPTKDTSEGQAPGAPDPEPGVLV